MSKKRPIIRRLLEQDPPSPSTASPLRRRQRRRSPKNEFDEDEEEEEEEEEDEDEEVLKVPTSASNSRDSYGTGIPTSATSEQTAFIYQTALEMLANVSLVHGENFQESPRRSLASDSNTASHSSGCQSAQTSTGTQHIEGRSQKDSNYKESESGKLDSNKLQGASTTMADETQKLCSPSAQTSSVSRRNDCDPTQDVLYSLKDGSSSTSKSVETEQIKSDSGQDKKDPNRTETIAVKTSSGLRPKRGAESFDQPQTSLASKASRNDFTQLDSSGPHSTSGSAQAMRSQTIDASTQTLQEDQNSNEGQTQSASMRGGSGSTEREDSSGCTYNFIIRTINNNQLKVIVLANEYTIEEPARHQVLITVQSSVGGNDDRTSVNTRSELSLSPLPQISDTYETPSMDNDTWSLPHTLRQVSGRLYQETDDEQELENISQLEATSRYNFACNDNDDTAKATDYHLSETSEANTPGLPASTHQTHSIAAESPAVVPTREARYQEPLARIQPRRRTRNCSSCSNRSQHRNMAPQLQLTRPDYKTVVVSERDTSRADQIYANQPHFREQDFPRRNPRILPRSHETFSRLQNQNIAHRLEQPTTYQDETRAPRLSLLGTLTRSSAQENLYRESFFADITAWLGSICPIPSSSIPLHNRELLAAALNYEPIIIMMSSRFTVLCLNEYQTIIRISPPLTQGVPQYNDYRASSRRTSSNATFSGSENIDYSLLQEQSQELSIFILNDDYRITSTLPGFASITAVDNRLFLSRIPSAPLPHQIMQIHVRGSAQQVTFERGRIERLISAIIQQCRERRVFSIREIVDGLTCIVSDYSSTESTTDMQRIGISNLQVTEDMQVDDSFSAVAAEGLRDRSPEQITADTPSTSKAASSAQSYNRSQNSKISRSTPRLCSSNETLNVQSDISLLETSETDQALSSNAQTHSRPQQTPAATAGQPTQRRRQQKKGKRKRK